MKNIITFFLLIIGIQKTNSPIGVWEFKEDKTIVEIKKESTNMYGVIISSDNPNREIGKKVFQNVHFNDGKWKGEYYLFKSDRWVEIDLELKSELLLIEYNYGIQNRKFHFYKIKK